MKPVTDTVRLKLHVIVDFVCAFTAWCAALCDGWLLHSLKIDAFSSKLDYLAYTFSLFFAAVTAILAMGFTGSVFFYRYQLKCHQRRTAAPSSPSSNVVNP